MFLEFYSSILIASHLVTPNEASYYMIYNDFSGSLPSPKASDTDFGSPFSLDSPRKLSLYDTPSFDSFTDFLSASDMNEGSLLQDNFSSEAPSPKRLKGHSVKPFNATKDPFEEPQELLGSTLITNNLHKTTVKRIKQCYQWTFIAVLALRRFTEWGGVKKRYPLLKMLNRCLPQDKQVPSIGSLQGKLDTLNHKQINQSLLETEFKKIKRNITWQKFASTVFEKIFIMEKREKTRKDSIFQIQYEIQVLKLDSNQGNILERGNALIKEFIDLHSPPASDPSLISSTVCKLQKLLIEAEFYFAQEITPNDRSSAPVAFADFKTTASIPSLISTRAVSNILVEPFYATKDPFEEPQEFLDSTLMTNNPHKTTIKRREQYQWTFIATLALYRFKKWIGSRKRNSLLKILNSCLPLHRQVPVKKSMEDKLLTLNQMQMQMDKYKLLLETEFKKIQPHRTAWITFANTISKEIDKIEKGEKKNRSYTLFQVQYEIQRLKLDRDQGSILERGNTLIDEFIYLSSSPPSDPSLISSTVCKLQNLFIEAELYFAQKITPNDRPPPVVAFSDAKTTASFPGLTLTHDISNALSDDEDLSEPLPVARKRKQLSE